MKNPGGKWKDALLKTSLPLELFIAEQLMSVDAYVYGEFSYSRPNGEGARTDFSVDIHAGEFIPPLFSDGATWGQTSYLIECKYNYPGVKWVFASHSLGPLLQGYINTVQDFCLARVDPSSGTPVDSQLPYCIKGIELHDDNANPQSISRALHQVRFGMVQLHAAALRRQFEAPDPVFIFVQFLCPIIVTTAPLYVLRSGLKLDDYRTADALDDLADEVPALIVQQEAGPDLRAYIDEAYTQLLTDHPQIEQRIKHQAVAFGKSGLPSHRTPTMARLKAEFHASSERVMIINDAALTTMIKAIREHIEELGKSLTHYGIVMQDSSGERVIAPARE